MGWYQSCSGTEKVGRKRLLEIKDKSAAALPDHVRQEEERQNAGDTGKLGELITGQLNRVQIHSKAKSCGPAS